MSKFNRKTACELSGMPLEVFKQLAKEDPETGRDGLPIVAQQHTSDDYGDSGSSTYSRYTALDVLALGCAAVLANGGGYAQGQGASRAMSYPVASMIIGNAFGVLAEAVRRTRETGKLNLVGYATMGGTIGGVNVLGTLSQIEEQLQLSEDHDLCNFYLIAPSVVAKRIEERALTLGLDWKAENLWVGSEG